MSNFFKYLIGFCDVQPPPSSLATDTVPAGVKPLDVAIETLSKHIAELDEQIIDTLNEYDKLTPQLERVGKDGKIYQDADVMNKMLYLDQERLARESLKQDKFNKKMTLEQLRMQIFSIQDATQQTKLLAEAAQTIQKMLSNAGGIAAAKDAVEDASHALHTAQAYTSLTNIPLSIPSTSSIQADVISTPTYTQDMFEKSLLQSKVRLGIQQFPTAPTQAPVPATRPKLHVL